MHHQAESKMKTSRKLKLEKKRKGQSEDRPLLLPIAYLLTHRATFW